MDIGNPVNIHPADKQDVGKRLALWALSKDYSVPGLDYCGPVYKSVSFDKNKAIVEFDYADSLICGGKKLSSFEIAGTDSVYYPAEAFIENNKVVVLSKKVKIPVAVRYAWDDDVVPNLFNQAGLAASPFRTTEN
jgi:sialate O-acetylesterase